MKNILTFSIIFFAILGFESTVQAETKNITGIWVFSITDTWVNPGNAGCGDEAGGTSVATITQSDNKIEVFAAAKTFTGTFDGSTGQLTNSYPQDYGTVDEYVSFTLQSDTSASGTLYWEWYDSWGYWCTGGGTLTMTKVTGAPVRNISGLWEYTAYNYQSECTYEDVYATGYTVVNQNGDTFTYIDDYGIHTGRVVGDHYFCTISYWEAFGITTQTLYFKVTSDDSATGSVVWTWTDGFQQCTATIELSLSKIVVSPTYDASGVWSFDTTNHRESAPGCPGSPNTGTVTFTQDHTEFRLAGYQGVQSGFLTGDFYTSFHSYLSNNGTTTEVVIFGLDDSQNGSGFALRRWTDGLNECYSTNDITLTKTNTVNSRPKKPELTSPADGAAGLSLTPKLQTGGFSDPDVGDRHLRTEWQISKSTDFRNIVFETIVETQLIQMQAPKFILKGGTLYYWRARFYDEHERASLWSEVRSFQTAVVTNDKNGDGIPDDQQVGDNVDTDGDGTPDNEQNDIKSVETVVGVGPVGVSRKAKNSVLSINSVESIDPDSISPIARPHNMTFGLIAVDMSVIKPIEGGELTIYLPEPAPAGASWIMYDSVNGWIDFSEFAVFSADRKSVTLRLKDWGYGDADGTPNGNIIDPGGAGFLAGIKGHLYDTSTNKEINDAVINISGLTYKPAADGNYFGIFVPGNYSMTVSANGYETKIVSSVRVDEGGFTVVDFGLDPNGGSNTVSLASGWNLISLSQQPSSTLINTVLASISGKYVSVWAYSNGSWRVYDPNNPGFSDLTTMEAGIGYWINMNESAALSVTGSAPPTSCSLKKGWNLVGYNASASQVVADALASIASQYVSVWAYINGSWKVYDPNNPGFSDLTNMEPGYGYWINTTEACTWVLQ